MYIYLYICKAIHIFNATNMPRNARGAVTHRFLSLKPPLLDAPQALAWPQVALAALRAVKDPWCCLVSVLVVAVVVVFPI